MVGDELVIDLRALLFTPTMAIVIRTGTYEPPMDALITKTIRMHNGEWESILGKIVLH